MWAIHERCSCSALQYFMFCSQVCSTIYPSLRQVVSSTQQVLPGCKPSEWECSFPLFVLQTWIHMLVIVGSILSYFFFTLAFGAMCVTCNPPSNPYWIMQEHMLDPVFYLVCVLTTCIALLPRYGVCFIKWSHRLRIFQANTKNGW